jgi:hypothetical protein
MQPVPIATPVTIEPQENFYCQNVTENGFSFFTSQISEDFAIPLWSLALTPLILKKFEVDFTVLA